MKNRLTAWLGRVDWNMIGTMICIYLIWKIGQALYFDTWCWFLLMTVLIGSQKYRNPNENPYFFAVAVPTLFLFYMFTRSGDSFWWSIADGLFKNHRHPFVWDDFMRSIPLNDAAWARTFHKVKLDRLFAWIYAYGFVLPLWMGIIYCIWSRRLKDMFSFALSGHILQLPLILPFYNLILLREVWFVKGQPDLLYRHFASENEKLTYVMNCFPSMHTSISFAMFLVAMRQKDRWFKYITGAYCLSIIWSTLYLQIHWVLDVVAGLAFGFGVVKLADLVIYVSVRAAERVKSRKRAVVASAGTSAGM